MKELKNINSLRGLTSVDGTLTKRTNATMVHVSQIVIDDFNVRGVYLADKNEYWNSEDAQKSIESFAHSYKNNIYVAPVSVEVIEGVIYLRHGEHRTRGALKAFENGDFDGYLEATDINTSKKSETKEKLGKEFLYSLLPNKNQQLTNIEKGYLYQQAKNNGASVKEISAASGDSVPLVYKLLTAVNEWSKDLIVKVQKSELTFTEALSIYEASKKKPVSNNENSDSVNKITSPAAISGEAIVIDNSSSVKDENYLNSNEKSSKPENNNVKKVNSLSKEIIDFLLASEIQKSVDGSYQLNLTESEFNKIEELKDFLYKQAVNDLSGK